VRHGTLESALLDVESTKATARERAEGATMSDTEWDEYQPEQARLRALVESVDREMSGTFSRGAATEAPRLADAWQRLVSGLALGTAPELRRCPFCARRVPAVATRCRYCMKASEATEPRRPTPESGRQ
jgi:hypothetical protein